MKRFGFAGLIVLLLVLALAVRAQDTPGQSDLQKLERALAPYITALDKFAAVFDLAPLPTCADLTNDNLRARDLEDAVTDGRVYCREITHDGEYQVNPGALGNQSVIERGVQQAYDIFGLTVEGVAVQGFNHALEVCLRGRGALLFLPAFAAPRPVQTPQSYSSGEFTCASIGSPGIVALVGS